jgi:acyl-[acyl-carrier-protein]-phospholipid O-acyltransferase/long-chain-fatty-acid--[acyl-carrier-protein] ligase
LAAELWPSWESAVVALPDPRKGERLILVTTRGDADREAIMRHAKAKHASELMVPSDILVVDKMPLLATGKPNYPAVTELAKERAENKKAGLAA